MIHVGFHIIIKITNGIIFNGLNAANIYFPSYALNTSPLCQISTSALFDDSPKWQFVETLTDIPRPRVSEGVYQIPIN